MKQEGNNDDEDDDGTEPQEKGKKKWQNMDHTIQRALRAISDRLSKTADDCTSMRDDLRDVLSACTTHPRKDELATESRIATVRLDGLSAVLASDDAAMDFCHF